MYEPSNNPKHKTALCFKFRDGFCPRNEKCGFAHGEKELRVLQGNPKVVLTDGVSESMRGEVNLEAFPVLTASSRLTKVSSPLVVDTLPGLQLGDDVPVEMVVSVVQSVAEKDASVVQSSISNDRDDSVSDAGSDLSHESISMNVVGSDDVLMGAVLGVNNAETQADDVALNGIFDLSPQNKNKIRQRELKMLKSTGFPVSNLRTVSTPSSPTGKVKNADSTMTQSSKGRGSINSPNSQKEIESVPPLLTIKRS